MRNTTESVSRRLARNSHPSTSSESDVSSRLEIHSSSRKKAVRKSVGNGQDSASSSFISCSERESEASTSLRRSAREPRPKRTLSPTPSSPKRRSRTKGSYSIDVLKENEVWTRRKMEKTKVVPGNVIKENVLVGVSDSLLKPMTQGTSRKSAPSVGISNVGYETTVADEDMENDLVDIQPFESSDTTNEVFISADFVSQRNAEQHISVSVLTMSENTEHSSDVSRLRTSCDEVPPLDKEIVLSSAPCNATLIRKDYSSSLKQADVVDGNSTQEFTSVEEQNTANMFDCRPESFVTTGSENCSLMDATNQMDPPILDGPIIVSQSELKSGPDMPPTLMPDGVVEKGFPKPMHYVVGEIYRVHTPNGTEQEVQLAVMDDGSEALVNANGDIVDMTPEDTYATIDICDIDFNFLDDRNIVCGLCGEVVLYSSLFSGHFSRVHPEMLDTDMLIAGVPYVEYLKTKLDNDRKNIQNGFKFSKQAMFRRTPRKVSQIRINPSEMSMSQLEVALRKKLLEKMGRRVSVSLVDKEHVKCGICNSVISINKKFEIVHVIRHFNAWHPTNHQCAGQWQKRTQKPGVGKPLSKQDFAVIDLSHTQPDNLQCIWCGMFIDATTIAVHFTDCHPGEVEVPKCLLCIQELVINARIIEKFGSDFDVILPDEFHIKVEKLNKLFTSESQMDNAIEKYLDALNGKRKKTPLTVERRVFDGDSVVVHTTAIPGEDSVDDMDEVDAPPPRPTNTNSRQVFGRHNKPKRSMVQPIYRQAPPTNSDYVKVVSDSHWKCKICDADLYGAVISACAIRHFKLKHPQESDSLQFEVVRARLDRISDGCMEFVHPQMLECLICRLTYQLHKPYNVCRGIRHLKSRHPEIMPEFNGEPLRRYRKTGTALRLDDDPNVPRRRRDTQLPTKDDSDLLARMKVQYPNSFDKVQTIYGAGGEPLYVLMNGTNEEDEVVKENMKLVSNAPVPQQETSEKRVEGNGEQISSDDVKPRQEVVFELSYDYDNLDADGKPQKHLVRVTPAPQNNIPLNSDARFKYMMGNEDTSNITEMQLEQSEANEMFLSGAEHVESHTGDSSIILGDILFTDGDGNEIIQRTTALPDGTVQQQYLSHAEDGSLFVLSNIVSAGLQPCTDAIEEVYDEELINDDVSQQNLIPEEDYENQVGNVTIHGHQGSNQNGHRGCGRSDVQEQEYDVSNSVIVDHAYNDKGTAVVEEYTDCVEGDEMQPKYNREVVIGDDIQYGEGDVVLNEAVYQERLVAKQQEVAYAIDGKTQEQRLDRDGSNYEPSVLSGSQENILERTSTTRSCRR